METNFDWDIWLSKARYSDIVALSPALSKGRPVPMYSPDRKHLYLGSADEYVSVVDADELKDQLQQMNTRFIEAINTQDFQRAWFLQVECREICSLLSNLVTRPEEYFNPEKFLE